MRVMTWNLWWRHGPWRERLERIAATLAEVAPDVCGLQEVWGAPEGNLAAELADRLGYHWCWASVPAVRQAQRPDTDLRIGNAVLSRWPLLDHAELPLPVAEGEHPRMALFARIDAPGGPLPFFTTHLTHRADASAERVAQVRALLPFVDEHRQGCAYPPVVTGDFNSEPDSDEMRLACGLLTAPVVPGLVLIDAWRYAPAGDPGVTWDVGNPFIGELGLFNARIDYVLVGPPRNGLGRVLAVRRAGTTPVDGVYPSDHYAVVADLSGPR